MTAYTPSPHLTDALSAWQKAHEEAEKLRAIEDKARKKLRAAIADDLKQYDVTNSAMADHLPWSEETVRGIAREYDVPRKRNPTVKSIKPKPRKRPAPTAGG